MAWWGVKGNLPFISLPDVHQMIGIAEIELGEDCWPLEVLEGIGHER